MRDRRNTNFSVSSTDSNTSASPRTVPCTFNEKKCASPSPSNGLPAPVTGKKGPRPTPKRVMVARILTVICGLVLFWQIALSWRKGQAFTADLLPVQHGTPQAQRVADNLPSEPAALLVAGRSGKPQWTISIPHGYTFPLKREQYQKLCSDGATMRDDLSPPDRHDGANHFLHKLGFFAKDQTFLDIEEAETAGALPTTETDMSDVCETSLTFVLESKEASFGQSLLLLWLSYGLAKKEGRAFFIDDSRWAWGRYDSYFKPAPKPNCKRPPPHYIVPCPHSARHLVVSSATAAYQFGADFQAGLQGIHKHGLSSQRNLFTLLRNGYEDLFHLTADDAAYITTRLAKLKASRPTIGIHIRRGDKHPFEYQYSKDYLPLSRFTSAAQLLSQSLPSTKSSNLTFLLASDDPDTITSPDLQLQSSSPLNIQNPQERIQLATKQTLDKASPIHPHREPGSAYILHKDENVGWEGGFYSALFYSLGGSTTNKEGAISEQALRMRELVGRGYLLDLAILGQSEGVVCAVSTASCRGLGVMLGWDGVKEGRWRNVDDRRGWSWDGGR